jgi:hypothetical protein
LGQLRWTIIWGRPDARLRRRLRRLLSINPTAGAEAARRVGGWLVTGEVDDTDAVQSVEHQLDRERREQEAEDLLGHEHAALV